MKIKLFAILILTTLIFCQCTDISPDEKRSIVATDPYISTQLLFSTVEYEVYRENKTRAVMHSLQLYQNLTDRTDSYSPGDDARVIRLADDVMHYAQELPSQDAQTSLEGLRDLKGQYLHINTYHDDHYLYYLWRYEEEMFYTTKAAMDPLLDLYEWSEFVMMVACMNDDWDMVMQHYPSEELLGNKYDQDQKQAKAKINLEESMLRFNAAVDSNDYQRYDLCDHGAALRQSYVNYLKTCVGQYESMMKAYLATI